MITVSVSNCENYFGDFESNLFYLYTFRIKY